MYSGRSAWNKSRGGRSALAGRAAGSQAGQRSGRQPARAETTWHPPARPFPGTGGAHCREAGNARAQTPLSRLPPGVPSREAARHGELRGLVRRRRQGTRVQGGFEGAPAGRGWLRHAPLGRLPLPLLIFSRGRHSVRLVSVSQAWEEMEASPCGPSVLLPATGSKQRAVGPGFHIWRRSRAEEGDSAGGSAPGPLPAQPLAALAGVASPRKRPGIGIGLARAAAASPSPTDPPAQGRSGWLALPPLPQRSLLPCSDRICQPWDEFNRMPSPLASQGRWDVAAPVLGNLERQREDLRSRGRAPG